MNAEFFQKLGFFIVSDFFSEEECSRLRAEISLAPAFQATVAEDRALVVDDKTRKTTQHQPVEETGSFVLERLLAVQKNIESHFHLQLTGCQRPQFLAYGVGDFYLRHRDGASSGQVVPEPNRLRQVSVVIFLNSQTSEPQSYAYCGGALTFYGIMGDSRMKRYGFPLHGKRGLLVAFPSDVIHEVEPVTYGERYSIVAWYY